LANACLKHVILSDAFCFQDADVTIVDTSVVALRGTVSIANTAAYNGIMNRPCPIIGAKVCALDYYSSAMVACDTTASDGLNIRMNSFYKEKILPFFNVMGFLTNPISL
jgi:hypothetical protein